MTRAAWAERKARNGVQYISCITDNEVYSLIAKLLLAEHKRAVRAVRRELEKYQRRRECETSASQRDVLGGAILACSNTLAALQKGRT